MPARIPLCHRPTAAPSLALSLPSWAPEARDYLGSLGAARAELTAAAGSAQAAFLMAATGKDPCRRPRLPGPPLPCGGGFTPCSRKVCEGACDGGDRQVRVFLSGAAERDEGKGGKGHPPPALAVRQQGTGNERGRPPSDSLTVDQAWRPARCRRAMRMQRTRQGTPLGDPPSAPPHPPGLLSYFRRPPPQLCLPDFCGACQPVCLNISAPPLPPSRPELPALPSLPAALPTPGCSGNQAADWRASQVSEAGGVAWACKDCPAGTAPGDRRYSCTPCAPGSFANATSGACQLCAPGAFAPGWRAAGCAPCPTGMFAPAKGAWACLPCPAGFSGPQAGVSRCMFDRLR
jgi:hypothetical protein